MNLLFIKSLSALDVAAYPEYRKVQATPYFSMMLPQNLYEFADRIFQDIEEYFNAGYSKERVQRMLEFSWKLSPELAKTAIFEYEESSGKNLHSSLDKNKKRAVNSPKGVSWDVKVEENNFLGGSVKSALEVLPDKNLLKGAWEFLDKSKSVLTFIDKYEGILSCHMMDSIIANWNTKSFEEWYNFEKEIQDFKSTQQSVIEIDINSDFPSIEKINSGELNKGVRVEFGYAGDFEGAKKVAICNLLKESQYYSKLEGFEL